MFVPYKPDSELAEAFIVYRTGGRCVCGCSAVCTSSKYPDGGYCLRCSKKREEFINSIVGDIDICSQNESQMLILLPLEQSRKFMIKEVLYYIIDSYFATNDAYHGNFVEPYENPIFIANCLCQKVEITKRFLLSINISPTYENNKRNNLIIAAQLEYLKKISNMKENDLNHKDELLSKMDGNSYAKMPTNA